jgi:hypothetical protein
MIEAMAQLGKYARPYAQSVRTFMNLFFHLEHRALRIDLQILDLQSGFSSFYTSYDEFYFLFFRWFNLPAAPHQRGGGPETVLLHRR